MYDNLYQMGPGNEAYPADRASVPWCVALLLGTKSKKFITMSSRRPSLETYSSSVANTCNKMLWKAALGSNEPEWWRFSWGSKPTSPCTMFVSPEIRAYTRDLRATIFNSAKKAI